MNFYNSVRGYGFTNLLEEIFLRFKPGENLVTDYMETAQLKESNNIYCIAHMSNYHMIRLNLHVLQCEFVDVGKCSWGFRNPVVFAWQRPGLDDERIGPGACLLHKEDVVLDPNWVSTLGQCKETRQHPQILATI
jgi:hypothetical protein